MRKKNNSADGLSSIEPSSASKQFAICAELEGGAQLIRSASGSWEVLGAEKRPRLFDERWMAQAEIYDLLSEPIVTAKVDIFVADYSSSGVDKR